MSASAPPSAGVTDGQRSRSRASTTGSMGRSLGAELHGQQVVLVPDPARNQESIDQHPEERDQHPDDRQRQDELRNRDAGALEIEIVGAEQPEEKPQQIGGHDGFLVGLEDRKSVV